MAATTNTGAIRNRIYDYLLASGVEIHRDGAASVRESWLVSGTALDGVSASFSDADDVIEFGLLSRVNGEPTNMLNASVVMDEEDARIYCVSEVASDLNFEGLVGPEQSADGLFLACDYFAQAIGAAFPA